MIDKFNYLYINQFRSFSSGPCTLVCSLFDSCSGFLTVAIPDLHSSPWWVWTGVEFGICAGSS